MKLFTKTFGCQMNFADSDEMARAFRQRGFLPSEVEDDADAVLVNTCTVRDLAEHKAASYLGRLAEWKETHPQGLIVLTGCAAERGKKDFQRRFPHVDLVVGAKDIDLFSEQLDLHLKKRGVDEEELIPFSLTEALKNNESITGSPVIQYVTIMRGCNYNCSYCIVPSVRGREIYRPIEEILADVSRAVSEGAKEVWLLGQTVNSYRPAISPRSGYDFADLLRDVNAITGLERLRFISPHPYYLTDKLVEAMAECDKLGHHMHLPAQSGSDVMLKAMKRNYTREIYLQGVRKLRARIPGVSITTDLIVGFPGETEQDFQQTLTLVDEADFDSAYCFKYSPRPGTVSAALEDNVSDDEKERRVNMLLEKVEARGAAKAAALVGTTQSMLVEVDKGDGVFRGKISSAWRVRIRNVPARVGEMIPVRITGTHSRELWAEPVLAEKDFLLTQRV